MDCGELVFEDENWVGYKNIGMCGEGDIDIINNWRDQADIEELMEVGVEGGISAIEVSDGEPGYDHAFIKAFEYTLTKEHCKPITETNNIPCIIYIRKFPEETE